MKNLHSKWFDLAGGKLSIFIFLPWMAGRNYSTDHSWFSLRPCCNFAHLQTCECLLESFVYVHAFCFWIIESLFIAFLIYSFIVLVVFVWGALKTATFAFFRPSFFHNRAHGRYRKISPGKSTNQSARFYRRSSGHMIIFLSTLLWDDGAFYLSYKAW